MAASAASGVRPWRRGLRVWLPVALTLALVVPLAVLWAGSLVPATLSVMDMGTADSGTGAALGHSHDDSGGTSLTELVADPHREADVRIDLRAAAATLRFGGLDVPGYTVNGSSPGPTIRAVEGDLVEVRFTNDSVPAGVTLHWHGVEVPNAMDGVAGVTQDALAPGQSFTYRFIAERAGTFWYHSHQVSHEQVVGGLYGALVIVPAEGGEPEAPDAVALAHTYAGVRTVNGRPGNLVVPVQRGTLRLRVVNTDNATLPVWSSHPVVVAAVDGNEVNQPTPVGWTCSSSHPRTGPSGCSCRRRPPWSSPPGAPNLQSRPSRPRGSTCWAMAVRPRSASTRLQSSAPSSTCSPSSPGS